VVVEEADALQQETEANALMEDAEFQLGKAKPLLEEATRVLKEIKVDDFYVLASITNPTPTVVLGMEVSSIMMGHKPKKNINKRAPNDTNGFFDCAKSNLLNEPKKFMARMLNFDKNNIPESTVKRVGAIMQTPEFTMEKVKGASGALVAIHKWVEAMLQYHDLLKIVKPKQIKVDEMREKLKIVRASLAEKRQKLKEVDEMIENLERMHREKVELENSLNQQIEDCFKKLERAGKLISGLEGEKTRWTNTVFQLQ
jgi:dynein heavy chain